MIVRHTIEETLKSCLVIVVLIFGKLTWCIPVGDQILFPEDFFNASFDSFESHYSDESFTLNTVGCVIPPINVQDVSIRRFIENPKKVAHPCKNYEHRLLENNQTHIWAMRENFHYYNIHNESNFECCYKSFYRPQSSRGTSRKLFDDRIKYLDCIIFHNSIEVNNEFVKVRCFYESKIIYTQYFTFTPKKPFAFYRDDPFKMPTNQTLYNVIIMGLGSMSRQNFYRTMPNTLELLKKYNVVELKGYNTVSDDTFQNMIPVLVGMNTSELNTTCWPKAQTTLDNCPFIWERFKDMGYYTALVEDTAKFGMFNNGKFGFRGSPTDYYLHPFMHESENLIKTHRKIISVKQINNYMRQLIITDSVPSCMGDKYYFEVLLKYVESLTTTLRNSKLFGLFWETSMSHDHLNDPLNMDKAYVALIEKMESTGYLNDTIMIFLSDHGLDMGDIGLTKQGRMEQRLPFVFILTPPSFRKKYRLAYNNLKVNKGRLTTPFDVHKTLTDLIDTTDITDEDILKRSAEAYTHVRGISLFLQIPRNRTCEKAGIGNKWCTCYNYVKLPVSSPILIKAIHFFTDQVNEMLKPHSQCLKLIVDEIIVAKEMLPGYERNVEWRDFSVIVRMAPGGGIFETMMRFYNNEWNVVDHVKRLNFPGFRSLCVDDANLRLFCFCK